MATAVYTDLNPEQQKAVLHLEGPLLVLAGAGSGKTRIVTCRIAHLLSLGVPPQKIAAVTFTNKAAGEMKERVRSMTSQDVLAATFHSFCVRILRESIDSLGYTRDFVIYDEEDSTKLLKECLRQLAIPEDREKVRTIHAKISQLKNDLVSEATPSEEEIFKIFSCYQQKLASCNSVDFDDILFLTVRLFERYPHILEKYQNRFEWLLIDEYQDTNHAQYMLAKLLSQKHRNLFAVGDPDQSIYSWRGANIQNILQFEKDYPGAKIIYLEQNYRSHEALLQAANALISHNSERFEKNLWSKKTNGAPPQIILLEDEREEAQVVIERLLTLSKEHLIPWNECAIFYRTNFQSRTFEDGLLRHKIPYQIIGGLSFYQRREIKDLLSWLRLLLGNQDLIAFKRTIQIPKRGIGETTVAKIVAFSTSNSIPLLAACQIAAEGKSSLGISSKAAGSLREYLSTLQTLTSALQQGAKISLLLEMLLTSIRYVDYLKLESETFEERKDNVRELINKAIEWEDDHPEGTLSQFLEELSLQTSQEKDPHEAESVKLMTLHNGKGLEFRLVFMVGMEEELFPHINSRESVGGVEEERRLCYVGMTRSKELLLMTAVERRFLWDSRRMMRPSRFLREIPSHLCNWGLRKKERIDFEDEKDFSESISSGRSAKSDGEFSVGDNVRHPAFGVGVVTKVFESSLGATLEVSFVDGTKRTLVVKYAKLLRV